MTEQHIDKRDVTVDFDHHSSVYRTEFAEITEGLQSKCPVAWSPKHDGYWVTSGHAEIFEFSRHAMLFSNDHDPENRRKGYQGISIPCTHPVQAGFLEMDPPEQRDYRKALNPYLSPAAVARWRPMVEDFSRACIDEVIESGNVDFVDDLANIVPAVLTLAMLGLPLADWKIYCDPTHASVYTPVDSPEQEKVMRGAFLVLGKLTEGVAACRANPKPGMINGLLEAEVAGEPMTDENAIGTSYLIIGGGFDTTTALTAHSLEWLSNHPEHRGPLLTDEHLLATATEEFLRYFTPAQGDARTVAEDCTIGKHAFNEGDRILFSWAMSNRDPDVFPDPNDVQLDRMPNRHNAFGVGVHRCIGSNFARMTFRAMVTEVLRRMPDYRCEPGGAVHYDTIGVINGIKNLPATFTPGARTGPSLAETLAAWQERCDTEGLTAPIGRKTD